MIVGAQKAATTSLKNYLGEHPAILTHPQPEFSFFQTDAEYNNGFDSAYKKAFDTSANYDRLVAKYATMYMEQRALKRLYQHNSECQIVFILRNPVERAYSAYQMGVYKGWEKRDFPDIEDVIKRNDKEDHFYRFYLWPGYYVDQLKIILTVFPKKNVRIIKYENLSEDPEATCIEILESLGLSFSNEIDFSKKHNVSKKPKIQMMGSIFNWIGKNNLGLIPLLRKLIGPSRLERIVNYIYNLNDQKKKDTDSQIPIGTQEVLHNYYAKSILELENITGLQFEDWKKATKV
ncbi:sulfotransferase family protein [Ekhidna sp. To15]|uniref:sulfotransferase family protein n=1 Tax=Ekhidna sp. To15 TaxID=3395267 RepID=UPI003F523B6C